MKNYAFTMAEILLSLTIIGVVAAITLPSLTGNINERTWNTQRKALYARMSQAIALMPALNGYGTLKEESSSGAGDAVDTATETFITNGLAKVLKINNICDNEHLEDCGIPTKISTLNGTSQIDTIASLYDLKGLNCMLADGVYVYNSGTSSMTNPNPINTKSAAFETANGESILTFYNPQCQGDMEEGQTHLIMSKMCANFIYDLNGNKGPNTVGKDIGVITVLYPTDSNIVAPVPLNSNAGATDWYSAPSLCTKQDSESRIPNRDELASLFFNRDLFNLPTAEYWSSSVVSVNNSIQAWKQGSGSGFRYAQARTNSGSVRCVKR